MTEYLGAKEVAVIIGMTPEWVQQQCAAGHLRAVKLGSKWRIARPDLDRFMGSASPSVTPDNVRLSARQRRRSA